MSAFDPSNLKYDSQGLIPAIIQDVANNDEFKKYKGKVDLVFTSPTN